MGLRVLIPRCSGNRVREKGPGTDAGRLAEGLDPEETPRGNNMLACKTLAELGP